MSERIDIMFFCLGNICRSPLAEGLFRHKIGEANISDRFHVESSGTGAYHVGESPDPGSQAVARRRLGLDISDQQAQQLSSEHIDAFDYLVAMDHSNRRNARRLRSIDKDDILLLRDFEPDTSLRGQGVPDPYGGGGDQFELVFDIVDRCLDEFLVFLDERHDVY